MSPAERFDVDACRREYPALDLEEDGRRLVYLDSACTALKPRVVAEALSDFYGRGGCGGKRSTHRLSQRVEEAFEEARREIAVFVGAESPAELVLTSGTTEAANLLARAFPYEEGRREVVVSELEHNAALLPFLESSRRGEVELRLAPSRDGAVAVEDLDALIGPRTALVVLTRASNVLGGAQPIAQACRLAHERGALVFSDYAQYLPTHRESLAASNVDFAAFSGHKLGGPFGVGVLYGKEHLLNGLGVYKVGGGAVKEVRLVDGRPIVSYLDAPARLEPGVPDFGGVLGLAAALRLRASWPQAALRAHIAALVRRAAEGLAEVPGLRVLGAPERLAEGSLVSFHPTSEALSIADLNLYLNHELPNRFIAVRAGEHCAHLAHRRLGLPATVRASFGPYNTVGEVDLLLEAVRDYAAACA